MNNGHGHETIYRGRHYQDLSTVEITCKDGLISSIVKLDDGDKSLPIIAPGLVDLQINGYKGIDINLNPMDTEELTKLIESLWAEGVTSFLPTIITNDAQTLDKLLTALNKAIEGLSTDLPYEAVIEGIHLEGPFLSPEDGPRGAHNREWIIPPDLELAKGWLAASNGRLRILTFSPEWEEAPALVDWCVKNGIIASIGHTNANSAQIQAAIAAGATMSTHLGNGANPVLPRHPNYIWEQLAADELYACVITDGFHIPDSVIKSFYRGKAGKMVIVSDTVALAGMPPGRYDAAIGGAVVLTEAGRLHLAHEERLLAGSALPLLHGVQYMSALGLCSWHEAWNMGSLLPVAAIGKTGPHGIELGAPADFVLMERVDGGGITIQETIKSGISVFVRK